MCTAEGSQRLPRQRYRLYLAIRMDFVGASTASSHILRNPQRGLAPKPEKLPTIFSIQNHLLEILIKRPLLGRFSRVNLLQGFRLMRKGAIQKSKLPAYRRSS
jgi:hypothetical protein